MLLPTPDSIIFTVLITIVWVLRVPMVKFLVNIVDKKYKHIDVEELRELTRKREKLRFSAALYSIIALFSIYNWIMGFLTDGYSLGQGVELNLLFFTFTISAIEGSNNFSEYRVLTVRWKELIIEEVKRQKKHY